MAPTPPLRRNKSIVITVIFLTAVLFFNVCLSQYVVENLPGFPGKLPFTLQTGYIGVGENEEVQLFYYFIESENNPEEDPLVLWLTGGPGCSGLSGLVYEVGPFTIDFANSYGNIPSLKVNDYSWTKVANIIFLDQPVGTGFSYSETRKGYYSSDTTSATHAYDFLRKWLLNNPQYLKNPLYICGDSYAGIILPLVVDKVYDGIEIGSKPLMNMKGYSLGNPITDKHYDFNGRIPYAHRMGLLSDRLFQSAKELCRGTYLLDDAENALCQNILERANQCFAKVRVNHILEPACVTSSEDELHEPEHVISYTDKPTNLLQSSATMKKSWCRDDNYVFLTTWANDKSVQKALHVREGKIKKWMRCNKPGGTYVYNVTSTIDFHKKFTAKGCRTLIYSGDHDLNVPHVSTERWIDSLSLAIQSDWRPWFVDSQVAGYTMTYEHGAYELTYATVKGAGHTAPEYKPIECLAMIRHWFGLENTLKPLHISHV